MRLEDLDAPRVEPGMADAALRDLEWLGLDWDGAPLVQSSGADRLKAAVDALVESGNAYACVCSRADVRRVQSAPQQGDVEIRYPGTCRGRFASLEEAERVTGLDASLRFRVPDGEIEIRDRFHPPARFDVQREIGDFMIARRDGSPAYQLAVVVDDAFQGVTEVLRGDDLLPSAARQWHLQTALGFSHPDWVHVPLVLDATGRRLAKRERDLGLFDLRERGVDPRAIVAWALQSGGIPAPERVTARQAVPLFSLERLSHEPPRLDAETLAKLMGSR